MTLRPEFVLRVLLTSNAVFSALCGLSILVFTSTLSEWMYPLPPEWLRFIGLALLPFAAWLPWAALRQTIDVRQVRLIIILDWAWVAASAVLILLQAGNLRPFAYWLIAVIACAITSFAWLQGRYLAAMQKAGSAKPTLNAEC